MEYGLVAQLGERRVRNAEVEGSIPFESTKRGPDEPGNDLFRWSCVRSVPAAAEKAVKENRHPALWPGASARRKAACQGNALAGRKA